MNGWDQYYLIFVSAGLAFLIPGLLWLVSSIMKRPMTVRELSPLSGISQAGMDMGAELATSDDFMSADAPADIFADPSEARREAKFDSSVLGRRINTRFYLSATTAILLLCGGLILVPLVRMVGGSGKPALEVVLVLIALVLFLGLGLIYSARKGDLDWIQSFRKAKE